MVAKRSFPCVVMRGGTTRGLFFHRRDLPEDPGLRDRVLMAAIGGPDPRQVDGLGGADLLLSKVAIVAASRDPRADVACTFGSVPPGSPKVVYGTNCGNLIGAVALFAVQEGLVDHDGTSAPIRIYNEDADSLVEVYSDLGGVVSPPERSGSIAPTGMPPTGAEMRLEFVDPAGPPPGTLLPTGSPVNAVELPDGRTVPATIVNAGALYAFVVAADLAVPGTCTSETVQSAPEMIKKLEYVRGCAAVIARLVPSPREALTRSPGKPKLALVSPPQDYRGEGTGEPIEAGSLDLVCRIISCQQFHKAYAVTGAVATAAAAVVPGSIVHRMLRSTCNASGRGVRIGHPTGVMACSVRYTIRNGEVFIERAGITRTARRIMEGQVFVSFDEVPAPAAETPR